MVIPQLFLPTPSGTANDGSGSGLDADLLDGVEGSNQVRIDTTNIINARHRFNAPDNGWDTIATSSGNQGALEVYNTGTNNDAFMSFHTVATSPCICLDLASMILLLVVGRWVPIRRIRHQGNDGAGSGLDADILDGVHGYSFTRSDADD